MFAPGVKHLFVRPGQEGFSESRPIIVDKGTGVLIACRLPNKRSVQHPPGTLRLPVVPGRNDHRSLERITVAIVLNPQYAVTVRRSHESLRPVASPGRHLRSSGEALQFSSTGRTTRARLEASSARPSVDVYRRRRRVAVAVLITIAAAVCLGVRDLASRGDVTASIPTVTPLGSEVLYAEVGRDVSGAFTQSPQYYVVQSGDTMWSIASSLTAGSLDDVGIRAMVRELIALNGDASIDVGQRLTLPDF